MKKFISLLAVLALVTVVSSASFATPITPIVKTAKITFEAQALDFNVTLYTWSEGKAFSAYTNADKAEEISFTAADVTLGTADSSFARGTVFARISSNNLHKQPASVQLAMFTDNTNSTTYKAKAPRTEDEKTKYNGLVRKNMGETAVDGDYAPIEMLNVKVSEASAYAAARPTEAAYPLNGDAPHGVRYLVDAQDQDFSKTGVVGTTSTSIGVGGVNGGIWVAGDYSQYNTYVKDEDVLIFFGARFNNVVAGSEYGTDKITFEQFAE